MIKDLAVKHSPLSEEDYYNRALLRAYSTWNDFIMDTGLPKIDMSDYFLFRWNVDYCKYNKKYRMELYYIQRRNGKIACYLISEIKDSDEESIREFLSKYWVYMKKLWQPISKLKRQRDALHS